MGQEAGEGQRSQAVGADDIMAAVFQSASPSLDRAWVMLQATPSLSGDDVRRLVNLFFDLKGKRLSELESEFRRLTTAVIDKKEKNAK